jgi:hypothetical protein
MEKYINYNHKELPQGAQKRHKVHKENYKEKKEV